MKRYLTRRFLDLETKIFSQQVYEHILGVLDRHCQGLVLLNSSSTPVFISAHANLVLKAEEGMKHESNKIVPISPETKLTYQKLLTQLKEEPNNSSFKLLMIPRTHQKLPLQVLMYKICPVNWMESKNTPEIALLFFDPEMERTLTLPQLKLTYNLTETEAKLVLLLSKGLSLERAALELGHRVSTSRNLLKRVFCKTDTNKQHELVVKVLRLSIPYYF
jgi:DNA-binding CsgD family transcriptional regulator